MDAVKLYTPEAKDGEFVMPMMDVSGVKRPKNSIWYRISLPHVWSSDAAPPLYSCRVWVLYPHSTPQNRSWNTG